MPSFSFARQRLCLRPFTRAVRRQVVCRQRLYSGSSFVRVNQANSHLSADLSSVSPSLSSASLHSAVVKELHRLPVVRFAIA
ncbi:hypothetical protein IC582_021460 [Cucumis melo]